MIEIIATNENDCKIINKASNINRIELCQNLSVGGLTPNYEMIYQCCNVSRIPVRVMVRHYYENFFCSENEYEMMIKDIEFIKTTKAQGVVLGIITKNYQVDEIRLKKLVKLAAPLDVTFHRAFDKIINKLPAVEILKKLGVKTILTQGGNEKITDNLSVLQSLRNKGIEVTGGSGINLFNYHLIAKSCDAIHLGKAVREEESWSKPINLQKLLQLQL